MLAGRWGVGLRGARCVWGGLAPTRRWLCSGGLSAEHKAVMAEEREVMHYDVVIVGGGPAGLAAAIRLRQLCEEEGRELSVCLLEKGAAIGSHILSGNVFEPRALDELIPDWKEQGAPQGQPAGEDSLLYLTEKRSFPLPTPPTLHNHGNHIISLGKMCAWLGEQAEQLAVEIYPSQAAAEVIYSDDGAVVGVATGDVGLDKHGVPKDGLYARGMELHGRQVIFAEGCRGSCSQEILEKFGLRDAGGAANPQGADPQVYGLGIKEVWKVDPAKHKPGSIMHTMGWPLDMETYGGSFLYHAEDEHVYVGFVVGLDYPNPYLSPYEEFQRWKTHPAIKDTFEGGTCISYGARCINEGGWQAVPKLTFPGGMLAGCSAGFVNVPKIKGSHTAMKTGMLAAEEAFKTLSDPAFGINVGEWYAGETDSGDALESDVEPRFDIEVCSYDEAVSNSWVKEELWAVRNVHPSFHKVGPVPAQLVGMAYSGLDSFILKGRGSWTFRNKKADSETTLPENSPSIKRIEYPKPDGVLTFDLLTNLDRSGVTHEHDQPAHLRIKEDRAHVPKEISMQKYAAPETRFCPARVYEYKESEETGEPELVINAQNCVHCKCCSIKMPQEYIRWTVPEGGGGPGYTMM